MEAARITDVAKHVVASGRVTAGNLVSTGRNTVRRALDAGDHAFRVGADGVAARVPGITPKLCEELVSLQTQLTLLARHIVGGAAAGAEHAVDSLATATTAIVGEYERVFDSRVMQAIARAGMPLGELLRDLADTVASLSSQLAALTDSPARGPANDGAPRVKRVKRAVKDKRAKRARKSS